MHTSLSTRIVPTILALGVTGSLVGISAIGAYATTVSATHTATGTVKTVNVTKDRLTVKVGKKTDSFKTTSTTIVKIASKTSTLGALKPGEKVTVTYTALGKAWTAVSITATA